MSQFTNNELLSMIYTLVAELEKNKKTLEELKAEAEKRELL